MRHGLLRRVVCGRKSSLRIINHCVYDEFNVHMGHAWVQVHHGCCLSHRLANFPQITAMLVTISSFGCVHRGCCLLGAPKKDLLCVYPFSIYDQSLARKKTNF